jgi:hypothetical protein
MRVGAPTAISMLQQSVVDLRFTRKNPKPGKPASRRMLCSNCVPFLNTIAAKSVFGFSPPTGQPKYNPRANNLIIVYDLFMQSFRSINASSIEIINVYPTNTEEKINEFWDFFSQNLADMAAGDKDRFMDS